MNMENEISGQTPMERRQSQVNDNYAALEEREARQGIVGRPLSPSARRILQAPQRITVLPVTLAPELLSGDAEAIAAFADEQLARESNRAAAEADELRTEGRVHVNTRSQRHE